MEIVDKELYEEIHVVPLRPTKYKIDCNSFIEEIKEFPFQRWGDLHHEFPRFATPLVNSDGEFKKDDPACYPLDRWNFLLQYPEYKNKTITDETVERWHEYLNSIENVQDLEVNEASFTKATSALEIDSLQQIRHLNFYRSCVLKWDFGGHFKKHIDGWHPIPWIRLWGTTNPDKMEIRFKGKRSDADYLSTEHPDKFREMCNVEAGRLYLIDTLIEHEALAYGDDVYQFFIVLHPSELENVC